MPPRRAKTGGQRSKPRASAKAKAMASPKESTEGRRATRSETERRVALSGAFLSGARGRVELARRLRQVWTALRSTAELHSDDRGSDESTEAQLMLVARELRDTAAALRQHWDEREARAMAACALVELLRIFSEAPAQALPTANDRTVALRCLLAQLSALGDASDAPKQRAGTPKVGAKDDETNEDVRAAPAYVLEALAELQPSVVLALVAQDERGDEEPPLSQLFSTLLGAIRPDHSAQTQEQMLTVMLSCLKDSWSDEMVDQSLLDAILAPLLTPPASVDKQERPQEPEEEDTHGYIHLATEIGAYSLAQQLIRRASDQLETPLTQFLNGVLIDAPAGLLTAGPASGAASALKEHVYTLIYEVHRVRASLLLYVLPNVCRQLQVDEVATRADAIKLLSRLFASRTADYGQEFPKSFRDFLGRFRDASKEIRMLMVRAGVLVWENKPELGHLMEKELVERVSDPEWEVRQLTVRELCDFCANNLELVSEGCVRAVGERMKDKKVVLRKETMTGLGQVYGAHIAAYWVEDPEDETVADDAARAVPTENAKKLAWVPDFILKCYAYSQQELRLRVMQLLDDILLPKHLDDNARAAGLLFILQSLDAASKEALRRILKERATCRGIVTEFLTDRQAQREEHKKSAASREQAEAEAQASAQKLHDALQPLFPETTQLRKLADQLVKWKDQSAFKHLASVCDAGLSQSEVRKARDRLVRCVGTKTPLGEFAKNLCRKLATLAVNQATMAADLRVLADSDNHPARLTRSAVELLDIASGVRPDLLLPLVQEGGFDALLVTNEKTKHPTRASNRQKMTDSEDEDEGNGDDSDDEKDPKIVVGVLKALANCSRPRTSPAHDTDASEALELSPALTQCLHAFCLGRFAGAFQSLSVPMQSEAARLAAETLANCYNSSSSSSQREAMTSLARKLCAPACISSSSPSVLQCVLQSLRVLVKRCMDVFAAPSATGESKLLKRLWSAVAQGLVLSSDSDVSKVGDKSAAGKKKQTQHADVHCLAIRVATNALVYGGEAGITSISADQSVAFVKSLYELLREDGKRWGASIAVTARYRAVASSALLKLARKRELEATFSVAEWHLLGFSIQDPSEDVRRAFLKRLTSNLTKYTVPNPHKYLSYLALTATEPKLPLKKSAKSLLAVAIERMRRVFEALLARDSSRDDDEASAQRRTIALLVPEYVVPYVVHLLAHHPDFPRALVDKHLGRPRPLSAPATQQQAGMAAVLESSMWSEQVAYLGFMLDGLVSAKQAARGDNIAFLLQILERLSACEDVLKPEALHIYPIVDTAVALLTKKIKDQSNLRAYPGAIFVPKKLFAARTGGSTRSSLVFAPGSANAVGTRRLSVSLSPIKATGEAGGSPFLSIQSPILALGGSGKKRRRARQLLPPTPETRKAGEKHDDSDDSDGSDEDATFRPSSAFTPPRRESLMRQARVQVQTNADESGDDDAQDEDESGVQDDGDAQGDGGPDGDAGDEKKTRRTKQRRLAY